MPRKKKIVGPIDSTTARIPRALHVDVKQSIAPVRMTLAEAINEGLRMWLVCQQGKLLKQQLEPLVRKLELQHLKTQEAMEQQERAARRAGGKLGA